MTKPGSGADRRKLLAGLIIFAVLAVEGLLYCWRRHYTNKKIEENAAPTMYGVFNRVMLVLGTLGLLYAFFLLAR